jgi:hypothetical protein
MMIVIACSLLLLAYLPIYILSIYKNTTNKINATATIILIIAGVGLFITESGTGLSRATSDSFWRGVTDSNDLLKFNISESKKCYKIIFVKHNTDTGIVVKLKQLQTATNAILEYTTKMKAYLISKTEEGITLTQAEKINLDALRSSGNGNVLTEMLLSEGNAKSLYTAQALKAKIENYKQTVNRLSPNVDLNNLNTNKIMVYGEQVDWAISNFEKLPLPLVIYNLIRIELSIKAVESAALFQIQ